MAAEPAAVAATMAAMMQQQKQQQQLPNHCLHHFSTTRKIDHHNNNNGIDNASVMAVVISLWSSNKSGAMLHQCQLSRPKSSYDHLLAASDPVVM